MTGHIRMKKARRKSSSDAAEPNGLGEAETENRRQEIIRFAGALFKKKGFEQVGMREIAAEAGIFAGSLYHHFPSKKALFIEVHKQALANNAARIERAASAFTDPWERLEAACAEHLELQASPESLSNPLMNDTGALQSDLRKDLVRERDRFELVYKKLVDDLPLSPEIDRHLYRISLIAQLNSVGSWYRPRAARLTLPEIARQVVLIFRGTAGQKPVGRGRSKS